VHLGVAIMTFWDNFYNICIMKGTKPNPVAKKLNVSSATVTKWKNGTIPNGETLIKIADFLDCSVDYLLGRTDEICVNSGNSISTGDINGDNNANMNMSERKSIDDEIVDLFSGLTLVQKAEIILKINEIKNKK
jgi:transcriptional regulator with XRE-family HTH domain